MTLKEKISEDFLNARVSKNEIEKNVLSALLGELDRKSKNPTDDEVVVEVKKVIDGCKACGNEIEIPYLQRYMPNLLNESQINCIISNQISLHDYSGMKDMGKIMKYFSENYVGQYDGTKVSNMVKSLILK